MLNTRRIGGASRFNIPQSVDVRPTDLSQPTDLFGAAKFTGQNGNLRYGALLASEDDTEIEGTLSDGTRVNLQATGEISRSDGFFMKIPAEVLEGLSAGWAQMSLIQRLIQR